MKQSYIKYGVGVLAGVAAGAWMAFSLSDDHSFQLAKNLDIFNSIVKELDQNYVDTIDGSKTIRDGIDAMLYSLDPYTVYYPEDDQSELEQMVSNSYGGIGSIITWNSKLKRSVISEPYEGMPAAKAGLKVGDILMEIDGQDLEGKDNQAVSNLLRGQVGTSFHLKIQRPGEKKLREFEIVRSQVQLPLIPYYGKLDQGVGYINLSTFSGNPSRDFRAALEDLRKQGITSLVIDVRSNGGGLLDEAVDIANFFIPRGKTLVTTRGKNRQVKETYKTLREPIDLDIPLAILVNSGTASASEILAGSLQDLDRAVVVGTRTYGKGLVQMTRSLPYGAAMKLTTSKYYIPSGRCVQAIDYQHRNEDGSVGRVPDSLTNVFHTAKGRIVRDGGGVTPDITIEQDTMPNIVYYLMSDNLVFDYATEYCQKHPTVAKAEDFKLTDQEFEEFKEFVKKADFKYDQQTERMLKDLKRMAEFEGYLKDAETEFTALEQKLTHDLDHDLDFASEQIRVLISTELMKRYYYQRGSIIEQLKEDKDLEAAVAVLTDKARYNEILSAPKVEE
ncbi:MAG: S41 family peptidase [Bacteroidaceae bacterium]|nr:S41 family peptidase [Bacteroidaceae bacterium]